MNTIYTLSTCNTSKRIIKAIDIDAFLLRDIKKEPITDVELDRMKELAGSYEALFSRRSRTYIALGLKNKSLNEEAYRSYILSDYTFLKRPVIIIDDEIFIGNQKGTVEALYKRLGIDE